MFAKKSLIVLLGICVIVFGLTGVYVGFANYTNGTQINERFAHTTDEVLAFTSPNLEYLSEGALKKLGTPSRVDCGVMGCVNSISDDGTVMCASPSTHIFGAGSCKAKYTQETLECEAAQKKMEDLSKKLEAELKPLLEEAKSFKSSHNPGSSSTNWGTAAAVGLLGGAAAGAAAGYGYAALATSKAVGAYTAAGLQGSGTLAAQSAFSWVAFAWAFVVVVVIVVILALFGLFDDDCEYTIKLVEYECTHITVPHAGQVQKAGPYLKEHEDSVALLGQLKGWKEYCKPLDLGFNQNGKRKGYYCTLG
jgi:hypothetical protein